MAQTSNVGSAVPLTATGTICKGGVIRRYIASTAGTVVITVGTAAGGASILASTATTAGMVIELGIRVPTGAYATLSGTGTFVVE